MSIGINKDAYSDENSPLSIGTMIVILTLGISYAFNGADRTIFPVLIGPISTEFNLSTVDSGLLSNVFTINIALFGFISGVLMTKISRKLVLIIGLVSYSMFTFAIPFATTYYELMFYRAMTGAGEALQISAIYTIIGAYFGSRRGTFMGINNAFVGISSFTASIVGPRMFEYSGSWRLPFFSFGLAGVVSALSIVLLVSKDFSEASDTEQGLEKHDDSQIIPDLIKNGNLYVCTLSFFFIGFSFLSYLALYSLFLRQQLGYSVIDAGLALSMYGVGALTAVVGGWIGDKLGRLGLLLAISIMALSGYMIFNIASTLASQMILSFIFGSMLSGFIFPRFISVAQKCVRSEHVGVSSSIMVPTFYLAGFFAGPIFGHLVSISGWKTASQICVVLTALISLLIALRLDYSKIRGS